MTGECGSNCLRLVFRDSSRILSAKGGGMLVRVRVSRQLSALSKLTRK